jgi:hypothetical protein
VETRSRIDLPAFADRPFEVYVNGVLQREGTDYEVVGPSIVFKRELAQEGKLGFWRWLSMFLGIAGTYRKHETVSVVYTRDGQRGVLTVTPTRAEARPG